MKIYKSMKVENMKVDEAQGIVEAHVNTMGLVDKDRDVITATAFNKSIANNLPIPVLNGHDQSALVGKVVSAASEPIEEGVHKLKAQIQMNLDTQAGREAFSNVSGQYVREWSVGFNVPNPDEDIEYEEKEGQSVRKIKNLDWVEVSTVIRGASPETTTISAKQEPTTRSEPESESESATDTSQDASATDLLKRNIEVARLRLNLKNSEE